MPEDVLNCLARSGSAGASMVEETGEMKVKQETRRVLVHFFDRGQL